MTVSFGAAEHVVRDYRVEDNLYKAYADNMEYQVPIKTSLPALYLGIFMFTP